MPAHRRRGRRQRRILGGEALLDLCYEEDSRAEVDANIVMMDDGRFVEFQATAEHKSFDDGEMTRMVQLAKSGISQLLEYAAGCHRNSVGSDEDLLRIGEPGQTARIPARRGGVLGIDIRAAAGLKSIAAPEENGATFEENARLKAAWYSQFAPGPLFADDSGLAVDSLGGAPGVFFRAVTPANRRPMEDNNRLLLDRLRGHHQPHRSVRLRHRAGRRRNR